MPNKDQFSREEIFEGDQLLILANHRIGALFPRQTDVGAEALFRAGAFVARLHDAAAGAGDHHESGFGYLAPKFQRLLVLHPRRLRPGRAEDRDLPRIRIGGEEAKSIPQFAQRGLNHLHIPGIFDIRQELEGVFDNVRYVFLVEAAAFVLDKLLNAPLQFQVNGRLFYRLNHHS